MYHQIVKRKLRYGFDCVNRGDYEAVLSECVPRVKHFFPGEHALGGERNDKEALMQWFLRLGRLLPGFWLDITDITVKGMPWNTTIIIRWTGKSTLANGHQYVQYGVHFVVLKWARVHSFRIYVDTQELAHTLEGLAQFGIMEAAATPIVS